jgi:hypothetical protein
MNSACIVSALVAECTAAAGVCATVLWRAGRRDGRTGCRLMLQRHLADKNGTVETRDRAEMSLLHSS